MRLRVKGKKYCSYFSLGNSLPTNIICSKFIIETLKGSIKYVHSQQ